MGKNLYTEDGRQIKVGMVIKLHRAETVAGVTKHGTEIALVKAIYHGPVGRVVLRWVEDGSDCEYFPSFIGAEWRDE